MNYHDDNILTEAGVVADLARAAAVPQVLEPGKCYAWRKADGTVHISDRTGETPAFKAGTVTVRDVASFKAYWDRHADDDSEVFADVTSATVTGVLDAHHKVDSDWEPDGQARWQRHRVMLRLEPTLPWQIWAAPERDRHLIPQLDFADFIEDNRRDLAAQGDYPDDIPYVSAADFIEIAQHLHVSKKADIQAGQRLRDGTTTFAYQETAVTRGGAKGQFTLPGQFCLAIRPYVDALPLVMTARFRWREQSAGHYVLGYFLDAPERVRQDAVLEIVSLVSAVTGRAVMLGVPSS